MSAQAPAVVAPPPLRPTDSALAGLRAPAPEPEVPAAMSWEVFWARRCATPDRRHSRGAPPAPPPPVAELRADYARYKEAHRLRACEKFFARHRHEEWFRER